MLLGTAPERMRVGGRGTASHSPPIPAAWLHPNGSELGHGHKQPNLGGESAELIGALQTMILQ